MRQGGITTYYCIELLDDALWVPGASGAIIAHDRETLTKIFGIIKRAFENLPEEIKPITKYDTKNMYEFTHRFDGVKLDNSIYVALKLRGGTVQNLHVSESAYIKDRQELNSGSKQAIPITGRISEETTGNGFNEFYDFYNMYDTMPPDQITSIDYKTYFYAWFEHPEYTLPGTLPPITEDDKIRYGDELELKKLYNLTDGQLLWRRWKIRELASDTSKSHLGLSGLQLFKQEYPANKLEAFQSGAGNVFDAEQIDAVKPRLPINDAWVKTYRPDVWDKYYSLRQKGFVFWKLPLPGKKYVVGVDPSDGEGADSTGMDVWEKDEIEQVCQLYAKVRPDIGAQYAKELCEFYNYAYIGVENNMLTFILELSKIYDNFFYTTKIDEKTAKKTRKIGWRTDGQTRDPMIDEFIALFEDGLLKINSKRTLGEMKTFVKKDNGKREHADGYFDDALFGGFIAIQMRKFYKERPRIFAQKPQGF